MTRLQQGAKLLHRGHGADPHRPVWALEASGHHGLKGCPRPAVGKGSGPCLRNRTIFGTIEL